MKGLSVGIVGLFLPLHAAFGWDETIAAIAWDRMKLATRTAAVELL